MNANLSEKWGVDGPTLPTSPDTCRERELLIDILLVRIHYIIVMIKWTGLAPWEFELHRRPPLGGLGGLLYLSA